jgi:hypothetical protein
VQIKKPFMLENTNGEENLVTSVSPDFLQTHLRPIKKSAEIHFDIL